MPITNFDKSPLRWAGGKSWLTDFLTTIIPKDYNSYYEPFLGGASCFLKLDIKNAAYLSDKNDELINFFIQIRDNHLELIAEILTLENTKENYYKIRSSIFQTSIEKAARFYFLNRLCFNGLYRVNSSGQFNVPYGSSLNKKVLYNTDELNNLHIKLQNVFLNVFDFEDTLVNIKEKDLVFLDPPYTVAHNKNGFIAYNEKIFTWQDQERLLKFIEAIKLKGAYFILTNAYHASTINLYSKVGKTFQVDRMSTIAANNNSRKNISELLVSNCI